MRLPYAPVQAVVSSHRDRATAIPLRGRWLLLARGAWLVVAALTLALFVAGISAQDAQLQVVCPAVACPTGQLPRGGLPALHALGLSLGFYAVALNVLFVVVYGAVAALIFWRKADDRMGQFASLTL